MSGTQTTLCELLKARAWEGFEWFELKQPATNPKTSQQALKIRKPVKRNFSVGEKVPFGWFSALKARVRYSNFAAVLFLFCFRPVV